MQDVIHLDLSELVSNPLRSGIQRVEREAIRYWVGPALLQPCFVDGAGRLMRLPYTVLELLCAEDNGTETFRLNEKSVLAQFVAVADPISDESVKRLLCLELYFSPVRASTHSRLASYGVKVLYYLYDFLPFLRPELFPPGTTRHCMHFLLGLRAATRISFLSEQTRRDYALRIARAGGVEDAGPVLLPGADGLQLERQSFSIDRCDFVAIGTVEPRKNADALLAAFEILWNRGTSARLVVAGRLSRDAVGALDFFNRHATNPNFRVMDQPPDKLLRDVLRRARAVIMPSEAEGFGLPPYEAVYSGIPAVASARLPSAAFLSGGVKLLDQMDPLSIANAVSALLDDETARQLWRSAGVVHLPTWKEFGTELSHWAQQV